MPVSFPTNVSTTSWPYSAQKCDRRLLSAQAHITVPGCRTPHLWLRRQSPYDVLGLDFTLLRFDPDVDVSALAAAATQRGMPMAVVDVESDDAATLYPHKLLLSRPDLPWLGGDPIALIDRVRGAAAGGVRV